MSLKCIANYADYMHGIDSVCSKKDSLISCLYTEYSVYNPKCLLLREIYYGSWGGEVHGNQGLLNWWYFKWMIWLHFLLAV